MSFNSCLMDSDIFLIQFLIIIKVFCHINSHAIIINLILQKYLFTLIIFIIVLNSYSFISILICFNYVFLSPKLPNSIFIIIKDHVNNILCILIPKTTPTLCLVFTVNKLTFYWFEVVWCYQIYTSEGFFV